MVLRTDSEEVCEGRVASAFTDNNTEGDPPDFLSFQAPFAATQRLSCASFAEFLARLPMSKRGKDGSHSNPLSLYAWIA